MREQVDLRVVLRHAMIADEDVTIPGKTARALRNAGLVTLHGCSDGDYMQLTDKGRSALAELKRERAS